MKLPQVLTDFTTWVDGEGFSGIATKLTIPEIVFKTLEKDLTGNAGSYEILTGRVEKMESELELSSLSLDDVWELIGSEDGASTPVIFRGSIKDGAQDISLKIEIQGLWKSANLGELVVAGETKANLKVSIRKLAISVDDKEVVYINLPTWEIRMGNKDLGKKIKSNLGL